MTINPIPNNIYRHCIDSVVGNCPFMFINQYKVACCSIDKICQVEYYGCIPQVIIAKVNKDKEYELSVFLS